MMPPPLIYFEEFDGNWDAYERKLHQIFLDEIANAGLEFRGVAVNCRRFPETAGRWALFWHLIQEGRVEDERLPDIRRCERLRWIGWIITNATNHPEIDEWRNRRKKTCNTLLWYREEYLVVLAQRRNYWLLKTAYYTNQPRRIARLRLERDKFRVNM